MKKLIYSHKLTKKDHGQDGVCYIYEAWQGSNKEQKFFPDHYEAGGWAMENQTGFTPPLSSEIPSWTEAEVTSPLPVTGVNLKGITYDDLIKAYEKMGRALGRLGTEARRCAAAFDRLGHLKKPVGLGEPFDLSEAAMRMMPTIPHFPERRPVAFGWPLTASPLPHLIGFKPGQPSTLMGDHPGRTKATNKRRKYLKAGFTEADVKTIL